MKNFLLKTMLLLSALLCTGSMAQSKLSKNMITGKKDLGSLLALYPKPITVVGAKVQNKVNWLLVGHTGIIGHDRLLVSMSKNHYTNQGILQTRRFSVNLVGREMLAEADYVGSVSGEHTDKSAVFAYHLGEAGTPVIDPSPLTMECEVTDVYETEGFDNFICKVLHTYADESVLDSTGTLDYTKLKPVLFEFTTYSYLATGEVIGKCLHLSPETSMCAKQPMAADGIVRLSKVEVYPRFLDKYLQKAAEVGEVSLRTEPGVLTMYAVRDKENPCLVTILETYASEDAYRKHTASEHFKKYKQETLHMVRSLQLCDQMPLNPKSEINNYIQ